MGGSTKVQTPAPDPAATAAIQSNAEIARLQFERSKEGDEWYKANVLPKVMGEMERQAKISQEQYELGRGWALQDRQRGDAAYQAAMDYDPVGDARNNAARWLHDADTNFNQAYSGVQASAARDMARRGLNPAAMGNSLVAAAAARANASAQAQRAGDMAVQGAKAEKLNVIQAAAGRSNPMAGMGLAMQAAGGGMQGMNFAQGSMGQNSSMFNAGMGQAGQFNNSVAQYGLGQQQLALQANTTNAQFAQGVFGSLMGGGMQVGGMYAASKFAGSDRRLKQNIRLVGHDPRGFSLYEFEYKNQPGVVYHGVMADEVAHIPGVVSAVGGYLAVDYKRLGVPFAAIRDERATA